MNIKSLITGAAIPLVVGSVYMFLTSKAEEEVLKMKTAIEYPITNRIVDSAQSQSIIQIKRDYCTKQEAKRRDSVMIVMFTTSIQPIVNKLEEISRKTDRVEDNIDNIETSVNMIKGVFASDGVYITGIKDTVKTGIEMCYGDN